MHEHGIAQEMVTLALEQAQAHHAERITKLNIEMSENVDESLDSLVQYLETLTRGTLAEGAQFEIHRVSARAQCRDCQYEFVQEYAVEPCPRCHSAHVQTAPHAEYSLASIEMD